VAALQQAKAEHEDRLRENVFEADTLLREARAWLDTERTGVLALGKLAVAGNGVAHGIYAFCPVVTGFETPQEWNGFRVEMMASFAPVGMLETTLAERLTLGAWRLRRVARYETEHLRSEQDEAKVKVGEKLRFDLEFGKGDPADEIGNVTLRIKAFERLIRCAKLLSQGTDSTPVEVTDANDLLQYLRGTGDVDADDYDPDEDDSEQTEEPADPKQWTVGSLRERVQLLAENLGWGGNILQTLLGDLNSNGWKALSSLKVAKRRLKEYRRESLLPDDEALGKVMRYESHLSRLFHRDLHELQRLQAMRQGQRVAAPIAIDVDVASRPERTAQNGV
jgi:hypothetical protein